MIADRVTKSRRGKIAMASKRTAVFACALAVLAAALWLLTYTPKTLQLSDSCEPKGPTNAIRARIQGQRFWLIQLAAVDAAIDSPRELREARARNDSISRPIIAEADRRLDSVRASLPISLPERRPSEVLREVADSLALAETMASIDSLLMDHAMSLSVCRPQVAIRSGIRF